MAHDNGGKENKIMEKEILLKEKNMERTKDFWGRVFTKKDAPK